MDTSVLEGTQRRRHHIALDDLNQSPATLKKKVLLVSFLNLSCYKITLFILPSVKIKTERPRPPSEDICKYLPPYPQLLYLLHDGKPQGILILL